MKEQRTPLPSILLLQQPLLFHLVSAAPVEAPPLEETREMDIKKVTALPPLPLPLLLLQERRPWQFSS